MSRQHKTLAFTHFDAREYWPAEPKHPWSFDSHAQLCISTHTLNVFRREGFWWLRLVRIDPLDH